MVGVFLGVVVSVAVGVMQSLKTGVIAGLAVPILFWAIYFRLLVYPFEAILTLISASIARRDARRGWRWCPARWDEVIWLPLPRLAFLLARLVRQDREAGLSAINFVAAERPLQRRAARAALLQVAWRPPGVFDPGDRAEGREAELASTARIPRGVKPARTRARRL